LSLPAILGTTPEDAAAGGAYLAADPERVERWRAALDAIPGFKIGISWQGNPAYHLDRFRSPPLAEFRPIARLPDVSLVSLQQGVGAEQVADVREIFSVATLGGVADGDGAFVDTAAIVTRLDLVITSDTALTHLAGALGVPTWVVLPHAADWRWGVAGDSCPWYPTVRLFRQPRPGDWKSVFRRVAQEASRLVEEWSAAAPAHGLSRPA